MGLGAFSNKMPQERKMKIIWSLYLLLILIPSIWGAQKSDCNVPPLTDVRIKEIVAKERAKHSDDIPAPFPQYETVIRRDGCCYNYVENSLPDTITRY
jgi:hypothetical protein